MLHSPKIRIIHLSINSVIIIVQYYGLDYEIIADTQTGDRRGLLTYVLSIITSSVKVSFWPFMFKI